MTRPRRLAILAALAALALPACTSQDADVNDLVEALEDADLDSEQARCVGNRFEDEFNQDQLNDLRDAETPEDYPGDTGDTVRSILEECTSESTTTSTTEAEGDATTTTAGG
jgi:hypothetical protein